MSSGRYEFAPSRRNVRWTPATHEAVSVWVDQVWALADEKARRCVWRRGLLALERERISERFGMVLHQVDRLAAARWQELRDGDPPMSPEQIQAAGEFKKNVDRSDLQAGLDLFPIPKE